MLNAPARKKRGKNLKNPRLAKHNWLYSIADVMALYGVDERTIYNWRKQGLQVANANQTLFWGDDLNAFHKMRREKRKSGDCPWNEANCPCGNRHSLVDEPFWIESHSNGRHSVGLRCPEKPPGLAWKPIKDADLPLVKALLASKNPSDKED